MKEQYGVDSMPETGENVAREFGVTRAAQDGAGYRRRGRGRSAADHGHGAGPATQKLCARLGLDPRALGVIELNEAFVSQGIGLSSRAAVPVIRAPL